MSDEAGPDATRMVPDGPDATRVVPDGPDATRVVPDGPDVPRALAPPTTPRFGRFETTEQLGAGAMGTVYRAHDAMLGRDVAIKALHASGELGVRERFVREARAIGAIAHPNILAVHDVGEQDGTPYLVMELASGGTLRERIQAGPLAVETVRELGVQIAQALAAAHAANIVHRDIKPANILCAQPATWKLADFGIARMPDSTLTIEGQFLGSPSYAAPESLRAGQFSPASDVYSLGATLYEALAGTTPHGEHDMKSLVRKLEREPAPLAQHRAVPGPLGDTIMAALARDPSARPTAAELARRLAGDAEHVPAVPAPSNSLGMKLLAAGLAAIAVFAVVMAVKDRSRNAASVVPGEVAPAERGAAGAPATRGGEPGAAPSDDSPAASAGQADELGGMVDEATPPMVVDQYGNPVDDDTAREILEQMERDARAAERGRGRGHGKKPKKDKQHRDREDDW